MLLIDSGRCGEDSAFFVDGVDRPCFNEWMCFAMDGGLGRIASGNCLSASFSFRIFGDVCSGLELPGKSDEERKAEKRKEKKNVRLSCA